MTFLVADRVKETCSSPGTGSVTLLGAQTGYQSFSSGIGNGNTTFYTISDQSGSNWETGIGTYSSSGNALARTTVLSSSNNGALVNFSSGVQNVICSYPAGKAVYSGSTPSALDLSNATNLPLETGTTGVLLEAKGGTGTNTGYYGFKNRIINGAMMIDQRNAGATVTPANGDYTLDRWTYQASQASKVTIGQNAGAVTTAAGFPKYLGVTSTSAYTVGASEWFVLIQKIEGNNFADCAFGTASASAITVSFSVYSSLTGTFGGSFTNEDNTRSYPFSYTISSANTWTRVSVTIPGDTTGTWVSATNASAARLYFSLGVGSTYSGTAGAWASTHYRSVTGATSVVGTNGATFYITGVQLEKGSTATGFDYRPYGTELALCQRYYQKIGGTAGNALGPFAHWAANYGFSSLQIPTMRAAPSFSYSNLSDFTALCAGTTSSLISFDCPAVTPSNMEITFNNSTGFVAGYASWLRMNTSSTYVALSAEL